MEQLARCYFPGPDCPNPCNPPVKDRTVQDWAEPTANRAANLRKAGIQQDREKHLVFLWLVCYREQDFPAARTQA